MDFGEDIVARLILRIMATGQEQLDAAAAKMTALNGVALDQQGSWMKAADGLANFSLIVGGASLAVGGFALKDAVQFSSAMELIATQAGGSQSEIKGLSAAVLQMAQDTGTAPDELAAGLYHLYSAGMQGTAALNALRMAAEGAKVGHANLEDVTNALIAVTESHIAGVHGEADAMGLLNGVVGASNTRLEDLAQAMGTGILPAARAAGLSFKDVGSALAVMTTQGVPAEAAATRLRMTFALMEAPTKKATDALSTIGMTQSELADLMRSRGLIAALTDLEDHLKSAGLTATQQAQVITEAFGGGRSASSIETLLQNIGMLREKYQEISLAATEFQRDWRETEKTTADQFDKLRASADVLTIELGDALLPVANDVIGTFSAGANALDQFAKSNSGVVEAAVLSGAAIGGLGLALKGAETAMGLWGTGAQIAAAASKLLGGATAEDEAATAADTVATEANTTAMTANTAAKTENAVATLAATGETVGLTASVMELGAATATAMGPLGWGLMAVTVGAFAIQQSPALRSELERLAETLGTDVEGAVYAAGDALGALGALADATGSALDHIGQKVSQNKNGWDQLSKSIDLAGSVQNMFAALPIAGTFAELNDLLQREVKAHDDAAAAAKRHAEALKEEAAIAAGGEAFHAGVGPQFATTDPSQWSNLASQFSKSSTDNANQLKSDMAALSQAIVDHKTNLQDLTAVTALDQQAVSNLSQAQIEAGVRVDLFSGQVSDATEKFVSEIKAKATESIDLLAIAMMRGASNVPQLEQSAIAAAREQNRLAGYLQQAQGVVTKATGGLDSLTQKTQTAAQAAKEFGDSLTQAANITLNRLAETIDTGKGNEQQRLAAAAKAALANQQYADATDTAKMRIAKATGDWAEVLDLTRQHLQQAVDSAEGKLIADRQSGNTGALPADRQRLDEAEKKLAAFNAQVDSATTSVKQLAQGLTTSGQLQDLTKRQSDALNNALAAITLAIDHHRQVTEGEISAAQHAQAATEAEAQAAWDASYAAASVAEKHKLLAQRVTELTSHFSTLQSATQSVIDAHAAVAQQEGSMVVDRLNAMVQAYEDATAILKAEAAGTKDAGTAGVKSIDDQTAILQAQAGILTAILDAAKSGNASSLQAMMLAVQVAEQQLAVSQEQAADDAAAAAWQQKIDADGVQAARDTAALDAAKAAWQQQISRDTLQVDRDKVKLAQDQLKLTELTNQGIALIASHFGDVNSYTKQISGVLQQISADDSAINSDQATLVADTKAQGIALARLQMLLDQDNRQLVIDQGASDADTTAGQQRISADKQRIAAEQQEEQELQALASATQAVTDAMQTLADQESKLVVDGLNAMVTAVQDATSVFTAMAGVSKAEGDGAVKAITDESAIVKAQGDIANATNAAQLAVARDELTVARDQMSVDQQAAAWSARIALDNVTIAQAKQAADALKASWDRTIDLDTLKIDQDKVKLAQDQLALTNLTNQGIDIIASAVADTSNYESQIGQTLASINADQTQIGNDQLELQRDTNQAAQSAAQSQLQIALDSQHLAMDQAASDASSQAGQMRIAMDNLQLSRDQVAAQNQTNNLLSMSMSQMQTQMGALLSAIGLLRQGAQHTWVGPGSSGGAFLPWFNGLGADMAANPSLKAL